MKELKLKLSRYLSAILMVAMVITSTPTAAMAAVEGDSNPQDPIVEEMVNESVANEPQSVVSEGQIEVDVDGEEAAFEQEVVEQESDPVDTYDVTFNTGDFSVVSENDAPLTSPVSVVSDNSLSFKVIPNAGKVVDSVSVNYAPLNPGDGDVYVIEHINEAKNVVITVKDGTYDVDFTYDEMQCVIQVEGTAAFAGKTATVTGYNDFVFTVSANDAYQIDSVSGNGVTGSNPYTIDKDIVITGTAAVTIVTSLIPQSYSVSFNMPADVTVSDSEGQPITLDDSNRITGLTGTDYSFKLNAPEGKAIDTVKVGEAALEAVEGLYTISGNVVKTNPIVDITIKDTGNATVSFDNAQGATILYGDDFSASSDEVEFAVPTDKSKDFKFKVDAPDNYKVTNVKIGTMTLTAKSGVYTVAKAKVAANPTVTVVCAKQTHTVTFINNSKAKISGDGISAEKTDAKIVLKNQEGPYTFTVSPAAGSKLVSVKVGNDELEAKNGTYVIPVLEKNVTITVNCSTKATGIIVGNKTVTEVAIDQIANTKKKYVYKLAGVNENYTSSDIDCSVLGNATIDHKSFDPKTKCFSLEITTLYDYKDVTDDEPETTIELMDQTDGSSVVFATLKVNNTLPTVKAPKVKVLSTTDEDVKLSLSDTSKLEAVEGKVYYHITATKDGEPVVVYSAKLDECVEVSGVTQEVVIKLRRDPHSTYLSQESGYKISVNMMIAKKTGNTSLSSSLTDRVFDGADSKVTNVDVKLKATAYETNLKLKKTSSVVYTGQFDRTPKVWTKVATPVFSKITTKKKVEACGIAGPAGQDIYNSSRYCKVDNVTGEIYVSIPDDDDVPVGTYTIFARAETPSGTYSNVATSTFTVKRGIEKISFEGWVNASKIYKAENKKTTYKLPALVFNSHNSSKPASTKVEYSIAKASGNNDADANAKYVTVNKKNGTVTIHQKYVVPATTADAKYIITVKAADYAGNSTQNELLVTIKNTKDQIGSLTFFDAGTGKVISGNTITSQAVLVVASESPDGLTSCPRIEEYEKYMFTNTYKISVNNKNFMCREIGYQYYLLEPTKNVKNVKITATTKDGGKSKITKTFSFVKYADDMQFSLIDRNGNNITNVSDEDTVSDATIQVTGNNAERYRIQAYVRYGTRVAPVNICPSHVYSVKADEGLTIEGRDDSNGSYLVRFTGKTLTDDKKAKGTLTFTYESNDKNAQGKNIKRTESVTLVNTREWITIAAAQNVKQNTVLYTDSILWKNTVEFEILDSDYNVSNNMAVFSTIASEEKKDKDSYYNLFNSMNTIRPITDKKYFVDFQPMEGFVKPGTYKFGVTYGIQTEGRFIAKTGVGTMTVTVSKARTAKTAKSFTVYADAPTVQVTAKLSPGATLTGWELQKAFIKGQENRFTDYFEISDTGVITFKKTWADTATVEEIQAAMKAIKKDDLKGYLTYHITDTYTEITTPITIKIGATASQKFKVEKIAGASVNTSDVNAAYTVKFDNADVGIYDIYSESKDLEVTAHGDEIGLKGIKPNQTKDYKVKSTVIYIVKADSMYAAPLARLKAEAVDPTASDEAKTAYKNAMKKYGTKMTLKNVEVEVP
ncbi:MAG: hypothetical protein GX567_07170 [Clostridia bacterium]|nr:hypothetical protein [Clostridia bacterium]